VPRGTAETLLSSPVAPLVRGTRPLAALSARVESLLKLVTLLPLEARPMARRELPLAPLVTPALLPAASRVNLVSPGLLAAAAPFATVAPPSLAPAMLSARARLPTAPRIPCLAPPDTVALRLP